MNIENNQLELLRLNAVKSYGILDTNPESEFDDLVKLATEIFNVPISTVTIIDANRQWFKASAGLLIKETDRDISFCRYAIENTEPLVVQDATKDNRFSTNPLVLNEPYIGFYAGVPLLNANNLVVGTFCIMDHTPRTLSDHELDSLKILASQAMKFLEIRAERSQLHSLMKDINRINSIVVQNEQLWKFSLEGSGEGVWEWDIKTDHATYTKRWKEMLGYAEYDLENTYEAWVSIVHPDDISRVLQSLNDYLDKKSDTYTVNYRLLCKDKTWKWVFNRGIVVEWNLDGTPKRMVGTHADISSSNDKHALNLNQPAFDALIDLF